MEFKTKSFIGLLVQFPSNYGFDDSIFKTCSDSFNYELDIPKRKHELMKEMSKSLMRNNRCKSIKEHSNEDRSLFEVIMHWDYFYSVRPGVHSSLMIRNKILYQSLQLFELKPYDKVIQL